MSLPVLPTAYFPPISWWATAISLKEFSIENHETYTKQTFRNRCCIYTGNGKSSLIIPVHKVQGNHTPVSEIRIDYSKNWNTVHWRSIESAYNKTPYFIYYKDELRKLYEERTELLSNFNIGLIQLCQKLLKLQELNFTITESYQHLPANQDLRLVLNNLEKWEDSVQFRFPRYMQAFEERFGFIPDLSILDLLFNEGPQASELLRRVEIRLPNGLAANWQGILS